MSIQSFQDFNLTMKYMEKQLELWGQPCTVFIPTSLQELGYENQTESDLKQATGVAGVGNRFTRINTVCHINFNPKKSVFYHFNWFPEDSDELCLAFFPTNSIITADSYVRTAQVNQVSKYGDIILKVVDIKDDGVYQTLRRCYFLKPVSTLELQNLLTLGSSGEVVLDR